MTKTTSEQILYPKDFIRNVLINEYHDIVFRHKYLSFILIGIGIEFLGKCMLTQQQDWHKIKPEKAFDEGVALLPKKYQDLNLRDQLRNGLAHTLSPKSKIALSEVKSGEQHLKKSKKGQTIIIIEELYLDFVKACKKVLKKKFSKNDKMEKPFLFINDDSGL